MEGKRTWGPFTGAMATVVWKQHRILLILFLREEPDMRPHLCTVGVWWEAWSPSTPALEPGSPGLVIPGHCLCHRALGWQVTWQLRQVM